MIRDAVHGRLADLLQPAVYLVAVELPFHEPEVAVHAVLYHGHPGPDKLLAQGDGGLGVFQGFQYAREANDLVFSALLPIRKRDVVKGKYLFVCFIELCCLLLMLAAALVRMTALADSAVYRANALMNANLFALGGALLIFGLFNTVFLGGYFRTAYKLGKPFVFYTVAAFLAIVAMPFFYSISDGKVDPKVRPELEGLEALNAFGFDRLGLQLGALLACLAAFLLMTLLSYRASCRRFEKIDL